METTWRLIDSGPCSAAYNMAMDEAIALSVRCQNAPPTLRLYGWDRLSLSLGCFQKSADLDLSYCRKNSIPLVRRPTGGRAILHGDELTYSFSVRTDWEPFTKGLRESYGSISAAFRLAFEKIGVNAQWKDQREKGRILVRSPLCFQSSSYGEIVVDNRKIVGSAQRRWKDGLLQQGTIPYACDGTTLERIFGAPVSAQDQDGAAALRDITQDFDEVKLKDAIIAAFEEVFGISLPTSHPSPEESHLAQELEEQKYLQESWNLGM